MYPHRSRGSKPGVDSDNLAAAKGAEVGDCDIPLQRRNLVEQFVLCQVTSSPAAASCASRPRIDCYTPLATLLITLCCVCCSCAARKPEIYVA